MTLNLHVSKNTLRIGEPRVSKSKFMHTLLESKSVLSVEQKAIVSCFVNNVAFLLGHPVVTSNMGTNDSHLWSCVCYYQFLALYNKRSLQSNHIWKFGKFHCVCKLL